MGKNNRVPEPELVEDFVGIALERRVRKEKKIGNSKGGFGENPGENNVLFAGEISQDEGLDPIILAVQDQIVQIQQVSGNQAEIPLLIASKVGENGQKTGKYIDDTTLLIIPPHLVRQSPFFIIGEGKQEILLGKLRDLPQNQIHTAIRMLASLNFSLKNGEKLFRTNLSERLDINGNIGDIRSFLRSPYQIGLKEIS